MQDIRFIAIATSILQSSVFAVAMLRFGTSATEALVWTAFLPLLFFHFLGDFSRSLNESHSAQVPVIVAFFTMFAGALMGGMLWLAPFCGLCALGFALLGAYEARKYDKETASFLHVLLCMFPFGAVLEVLFQFVRWCVRRRSVSRC